MDIQQISQYFEQLQDEMQAWRHQLHSHPELAYQEHKTAQFVSEHLTAFGYQPVEGIGGTGIVATLDGTKDGTGDGGEGLSIGLRADMDALPMQEENDLPHASTVDGVMHACGHDGHTTMLLAAAKYFSEHPITGGKIHFIFQPAEEGEAGAKAMIDDGLFERFPMDEVYGLHNWPGLEAGAFSARVGAQMAAFDVFEIKLSGQGAHAAMPQNGQDVLTAAASLQLQLQTIVARNLDPQETGVVSVTEIHGGDAWNVLPAEAVLRGCTRHLSKSAQDLIEKRMQEICDGVAMTYQLSVELNYDRRYPATINTATETGYALAAANVVGEQTGKPVVDLPSSMASEDFAYMLEEKNGCYIWLGTGLAHAGCILHSPTYDFNDEVLAVGTSYWVVLAKSRLGKASDNKQ